MCGIIGYIGKKNAVPFLLEGLKRLEYRGYDSAGVAFFSDGRLVVRRSAGKIALLEEALLPLSADSRIGIGHTRWATHGKPSTENAHPHRAGSAVVVHNGIIENFLELKKRLAQEGHRFSSETDSEVIAHLVDRRIEAGDSLPEAVRSAVRELSGSYAFCALSEREPGTLVAARDGCPLAIGISENGTFVASDIPAFLSHTRKILYLEDKEMAVITLEGTRIERRGRPVRRAVETVQWDPVMAEKGGYRHFMQKEIFEQPRALLDTLRGRVTTERNGQLGVDLSIPITRAEVAGLDRVILSACGTSHHAALVGKFVIEALARIPVEVDIASEFRYREHPTGGKILFVALSQSGETADTRAALAEAKRLSARTIAIVNVVGSSLAREADFPLFTHAGPEIAVASTKTFTAQLALLYLLGIFLGRRRGALSSKEAAPLLSEMMKIPRRIERLLSDSSEIARIARKYSAARNFLYLGRGMNYPIALEGALKLKEIAYVHAEGYPAGEMKHGPIALIDDQLPVIVLSPQDPLRDKVMNNVMEARARGARLILVGDGVPANPAEEVIPVPRCHPFFTPFLMTIPLQLFAYEMAVARGCDVDQPRNLAKSVTVE